MSEDEDPAVWADWSRSLFNSMADGGVWGVPRSGLIFRRMGDELVLDEDCLIEDASDPRVLDGELARTDMPLRKMARYQSDDYETIRRHFEAAGITVRRGL